MICAIDLFSGCGGLSLGLKQAGFVVVGAVENDPLAAETYLANHPEVHVWTEDIRSVTGTSILEKLRLRPGQLGLLAGCPPCQGFSALRRLNGGRRVRDKQNDLIFEFLRLVRCLRPKAVMLENVPGLGDDNRFSKFRRALERLGYHVNAEVKDAQDFGVPQRRRRLMLLAAIHRPVPFAENARSRKTVRDAFSRLSPAQCRDDRLHSLHENRSAKVKALIRLIPKDGGSRHHLGNEHQLPCHRRCNGFRDVYGRMAWDDVAPTITGGCCNPSKGRFLHPAEDRNISLREAALLQSFPPNYLFSLRRGKFAAAQMIGNALPPEFIRRHALKLHEVLSDAE